MPTLSRQLHRRRMAARRLPPLPGHAGDTRDPDEVIDRPPARPAVVAAVAEVLGARAAAEVAGSDLDLLRKAWRLTGSARAQQALARAAFDLMKGATS